MHTSIFFPDCPSPPIISIGVPGSILGNPPFEENEAIIYTCSANYVLNGTNVSVCTGPPDYNWTLTKSDLATCLRSKNFRFIAFEE